VISPTRRGIRRADRWGSGEFLAPRKNHRHRGVDFICTPGQTVVAPVDGVLKREARPYLREDYSGCLIESPNYVLKMFYLRLDEHLLNKLPTTVCKGQALGTAQDISKKYPGMIPHIHLEFVLVNPEIFLNLP